MNPDLIAIFGFVLLVCLIVFPFALIIHRRTVLHEERKLELLARVEEAGTGTAGVSQADYHKLEQRVRGLERIATDSKQDLALQIEQLQDLQEIDDLINKPPDQRKSTQ